MSAGGRPTAALGRVAVPLGFVVLSFLGGLLVRFLPSLLFWVFLPSFRVVFRDPMVQVPLLPFRLAAYSFFPGTTGHWFVVSVAIVLMSLLASDGLSSREYARALIVGALLGGMVFVVAGSGIMLGPTMAGWGLLGYCVVYSYRNWRWLSLTARFNVVLLLMAVAWVFHPGGNELAVSVAVLSAVLSASRTGAGRRRTESGKRGSEAGPAGEVMMWSIEARSPARNIGTLSGTLLGVQLRTKAHRIGKGMSRKATQKHSFGQF